MNLREDYPYKPFNRTHTRCEAIAGLGRVAPSIASKFGPLGIFPTFTRSFKLKIKALIGTLFFAFTVSSAFAAEEHHNLDVKNCRMFPGGQLQIKGISVADGQERSLYYSTSAFNEKTIDRYLSMCMTALTSGVKLRADYLECSGTSCAPKPNTTNQLYK